MAGINNSFLLTLFIPVNSLLTCLGSYMYSHSLLKNLSLQNDGGQAKEINR